MKAIKVHTMPVQGASLSVRHSWKDTRMTDSELTIVIRKVLAQNTQTTPLSLSLCHFAFPSSHIVKYNAECDDALEGFTPSYQQNGAGREPCFDPAYHIQNQVSRDIPPISQHCAVSCVVVETFLHLSFRKLSIATWLERWTDRKNSR